MLPAPTRKRDVTAEVRRTDQRWLVIALLVFVLSVGAVLVVREIYQATGPHPQITTFVRRAKFYANSLLRQGRLRRSNK